MLSIYLINFFFFNDTATTEIYTLSLHDALPIYHVRLPHAARHGREARVRVGLDRRAARPDPRRLRRGDPPHARRQEPGGLGAAAEDHRGGGAARLYGGECLRDVRRSKARRARTRVRRRRGRDRPQSLHAAARLARPSESGGRDRKSTRLNSSHLVISYAVFCLKKKKKKTILSTTMRT